MSAHEPYASMLDRYLDGELTGSEREQFERAVQRDAGLRAAVEAQRRIDERVCALFAPPSAPGAALTRGTGSVRSWRGMARLAACSALLFAGAWGAWALWLSPYAGKASGPFADAVRRVFVQETRAGFEPRWVCRDDAQFMEFTRDRLGTALLVTPQAGLTLLGWGYEPGLMGPLTTTLYAKFEGEPVMVVMDRADKDPAGIEGTAGALRLFRREIAGIALYEVSRAPTPRLLGLFHEPDPSIVPPARKPDALPDDL